VTINAPVRQVQPTEAAKQAPSMDSGQPTDSVQEMQATAPDPGARLTHSAQTAQAAAPTTEQPEAAVAPAHPAQPAEPETPPPAAPARAPWLDRTRQGLYEAMWHSAMRVDRWFGSDRDESAYKGVYGSIGPAVLYDQYNHMQTRLRFNVNLPLPQINSRIKAFVGRFDPNEFVTEQNEPSGAFARQYGPITEDQTLFGLAYHEPDRQGGHFEAGAGVRVALPIDPYVKGSYVYELGASGRGLLALRETAFWQEHAEGFGVTTRIDMERIYDLRWLVRWTNSATFSEKSSGIRGYSALLGMRGFPSRRAIALEISLDGASDAPVPLHDYGAKVAYRQSILRKWLIMEVRTSVDWPKDFVTQTRSRSLGIGLGFEMLFGTDEFLARPVTF
jgi:hypothetical protein